MGVWDVLYRIYETYLHNNAIISCGGHNGPSTNGVNGGINIILENNNYTNIHINRSGNTTPRKSGKVQNDDKFPNDHENNTNTNTNKKNHNNMKNNIKIDGKINFDNNLSQYYNDSSQFDMINNPIFENEKCDFDRSDSSMNSPSSKNKNKSEFFNDHEVKNDSGSSNSKANYNGITINDLQFSFNNSLNYFNNNKFVSH